MSVPRAEYDVLLRLWVDAELRVIEAKLEGTRTAVTVLAEDRKAKDAELNDVRHRFIPREVFDAYKEDQQRKARSTLISIIGAGLMIVGLLFTLFVLLQGSG